MKKVRLSILTAVTALMAASCSVYHPQAVDIPLMNHAGDTRLDASVALSTWILPDAFTFNLTGTHAFNDWFAAQAHVNYGGDNYYGQLAPGAYYPLGGKSVLEGYLGVGYGGASRDDVDKDNSSKAKHNYNFSGYYLLPFAQANFGWHDLTGARIDVGFGLKAGVFMPDYSYVEVDGDGNVLAGTGETYRTNNFLLEPQMMFRIGGEKVKFNLRLGVAWLSDLGNNGKGFIYDNLTASTGLTFTF